jgi:Excalibur calcium-binding domain
MKHRFLAVTAALAAVVVAAIVLGVGSAPAGATSAVPYLWQNCTHVHTKYRHGVGKVGAHDRTTGTPVTTFYRSTRLYNIAASYNSARGYNLDRDRDGIACEKR